MKPELSIIVPSYNEASSLPGLLERFSLLLADRQDVEVVIVDNGSRDATPRVLQEELRKPALRAVRSIRVEVNRGYGFGIMEGVRAARGEFIAWTHADLQTDPRDVLAGYERLRGLALASRSVLKGRRLDRPWLDAFFTWGMGVLSSLALRARLEDVNAQPKLFPREFLSVMTHPPDDFSLDLYFLYVARTAGWEILERPVSFSRRLHGEAKGGGTFRGKLKLIVRTWRYIRKLRRDLRH